MEPEWVPLVRKQCASDRVFLLAIRTIVGLAVLLTEPDRPARVSS
jgi:hypothetical protein